MKTRRIWDYKLLRGCPDAVEKLVYSLLHPRSTEIDQEWEPLGPPFVSDDVVRRVGAPRRDAEIIQAMVAYKPREEGR